MWTLFLSLAMATETLEFGEKTRLTVGAEARAVYNLERNLDFGAIPDDPEGALLIRASAHSELESGPWRGGFQINSATQVHRDFGPTPLDVDRLHILKAYGGYESDALTFTAGRDQWTLGNSLLVDDRKGPNIPRAFDGVRLDIRGGGVQATALVGSEVQPTPGYFDDVPTADNLLWGTFWTIPSSVAGTHHSVYYLGATRAEVGFVSGVGREVRHSLGTGWHGKTDVVQFDLDVLGQVGAFEQQPILAGGVAGSVAVPVSRAVIPGLKVGVASGDGPQETLGTFRAPFPMGGPLGMVALLAPSNTFGVNPELLLLPHKTVVINATTRWIWRTSTSDALYAIHGFPSRVSDSNARFVGWGLGGMAMWMPTPITELALFADYSRPGAFVQQAPPAENGWLVAVALTVRL